MLVWWDHAIPFAVQVLSPGLTYLAAQLTPHCTLSEFRVPEPSFHFLNNDCRRNDQQDCMRTNHRGALKSTDFP